MKKSRKWPIILIVGGLVLFLGSVILSYSNLFEAYELAGESFDSNNDPQSLSELETRQQIANYTRIGMLAGLAALAAGIVWYRKIENDRYKDKTKDKIVY